MDNQTINDARDVTVSMYISKRELVERAKVIVERRVEMAIKSGLADGNSEGLVETDIINGLYELGVRYFTQYAISNWKLFLNHRGQAYIQSLEGEIAAVDATIRKMGSEGISQGFYVQLGSHLMTKARIEALVKEIRAVMISLIEGQYFRSHILQSVIKMYHVLTDLPKNPFLVNK